ncbi:trypsin Inhibitor like cysteine rich domain protein [Cooperia oncophora]
MIFQLRDVDGTKGDTCVELHVNQRALYQIQCLVNNFEMIQTCTRQCVPNVCQCDTGYIRYTGACIPKYACPNPRPIIVVPPPPPGRFLSYYRPPYRPYYGQVFYYRTCPAYQYYVQCVPCEPVCNSQYYLCYPYCVDGCTCYPGYVRDMVTNNCVYSYYCPTIYRGNGR